MSFENRVRISSIGWYPVLSSPIILRALSLRSFSIGNISGFSPVGLPLAMYDLNSSKSILLRSLPHVRLYLVQRLGQAFDLLGGEAVERRMTRRRSSPLEVVADPAADLR